MKTNPPNRAPVGALSDAELTRLDDLLAQANEEDSMVAEELDGFFAALACCPEPVPMHEYLPLVLGEDPDEDTPSKLSDEDQLALQKLLTRHWNSVVGQLYEGVGFAPVLSHDENDEVSGNAWAIGFVRGMSMRPDAWDALEEDEDASQALDPVIRLVEEVEPPEGEQAPEPIPPEQRKTAIDEMLEGVMTLYDFFAPARERNSAPAEPIRRSEAKVGRNDACPCGSGKKYKACHGAANS